MTIKYILSASTLPALESELLLAHVLQKPREFIIAHPETTIGKLDKWKFRRLVKKRQQGIPLAYLTGHKEFFGLDFLVNEHTLVPRPDTEILVENVIKEIINHKSAIKNLTLIDVGTGSGCIPIAIAKTIQQFNNSTIQQFATDISRPALKVAKKNAHRHGVKIDFFTGNLLESIKSEINNQQSKIIITANLPYLTEEQFQSEKSIAHEPKSALVADKNGLALYEELLAQIKNLHLISYVLFLEIDPSQSQSILLLVKKYLPQAQTEIKKDLAGLNRVVKISLTASATQS